MKKGFALIELMIVIAVLGIISAAVLPAVKRHITKAKESAAKENLHILRNAIELYAAQHNGIPPGYQGSNRIITPNFGKQLMEYQQRLSELPVNPFNGQQKVKVLDDSEPFPAQPISTDNYGWIYKPATKTIKLNWPGKDTEGVSYFDY